MSKPAPKQYDNTNSGALFKNKDKTAEHPNWADYNGAINVAGHDYWLSAWIKETKSGEKIMSLAVKPKDGTPSPQKKATTAPAKTSYDDDIPF